jgi:adenosylcobinamide-GDP ribazoletransferase
VTAIRDALAFLTRLPVGRPGGHEPARIARALAWFPAVGLLVGVTVGGVRLLAGLALPAGPATVLALAAGVLLTGALHEDGLADTVDGLGALAGRERRLEILRDPRVGSYGALALVGTVLLAWSLLSGLDGEQCLRAAVVGHVLGRWAVLPQAFALPPARRDGVAAGLRASPAGLILGTAVAAATALTVAGPTAGLASLGAALVITAACGAMVLRALGGSTGDTYGLTVKAVEVGVYLVLVAAWTA